MINGGTASLYSSLQSLLQPGPVLARDSSEVGTPWSFGVLPSIVGLAMKSYVSGGEDEFARIAGHMNDGPVQVCQ